MAVSIVSLDEHVTTVRAFVDFLSPVRFLVIDHVAQFRSPNLALQTLEKLVSSACSVVYDVNFLESQMARI